jgi:hypothetical protein
MCRGAIPPALRFRKREVLPEGTGIAQVIYNQFLRGANQTGIRKSGIAGDKTPSFNRGE